MSCTACQCFTAGKVNVAPASIASAYLGAMQAVRQSQNSDTNFLPTLLITPMELPLVDPVRHGDPRAIRRKPLPPWHKRQ